MNAFGKSEAFLSLGQWSTTIGEVCNRFGGGVQTGPFGSQLHASDYSPNGIPIVMPQDMVGGQISTALIARVDGSHVQKLSRHVLKAGDIVFSRRGDVTRFAVVTAAEEGWLCGTGSIRIRLNSGDIDTGYLRHFLAQPTIAAWLVHNAKGVTMPNLNTEVVRNMPFVYPPLVEQRRIAAILDKADALRQKRKRAIALLDSLTQSIFLEMFGDPLSNPRSLRLSRVGDLLARSPNFGSMNPPQPSPLTWLSLRVANIQDWALDLGDRKYIDLDEAELERFTLQDGDIVLARAIASQEHLGKCVVVEPGANKWAFDSHLMRIRLDPDRMEPVYLREMVRTPGGRALFLRSTRKTTVQYNINTKELSALVVPVPTIDQQREFVSRVAVIGEIRRRSNKMMKEFSALFASLQHRAFSGQL